LKLFGVQFHRLLQH
jgi:hypothetical protein